jgi:hypothetical protein
MLPSTGASALQATPAPSLLSPIWSERVVRCIVLFLVGARQRFEYMPDSDQEIAEGGLWIEAIYGLAHDPCCDQPALLGLPEIIFVSFACDELA